MIVLLVIKTGALGDVVRTGTLVNILKRNGRVSYIIWHADSAVHVLQNAFPGLVDEYIGTSEIGHQSPDIVLSLEEGYELVKCASVHQRNPTQFYGFYLDQKGGITYTLSTSAWNDMGLQSRYGRRLANLLKKRNKSSFLRIWSSVLNLDYEEPKSRRPLCSGPTKVCIAPWSADRWPSKRLIDSELRKLLLKLSASDQFLITLVGIPPYDITTTPEYQCYFKDTRKDLKSFFDLIRGSDILVTADSLPIHVALIYNVPTVSFYAPTSAAEVDVTIGSRKIISLSDDYCSYKVNADNTSITASRIYRSILKVRSELP